MKAYRPICLALGILLVSIAPLSAQSPTAIANKDIHPMADSVRYRSGLVGLSFDLAGYLWLADSYIGGLSATSAKAEFLVQHGFHITAGISLLKKEDVNPIFSIPVEVCFGPESKNVAFFFCFGFVLQTGSTAAIKSVLMPSVHGDLRIYFGKKSRGFVDLKGGVLAAGDTVRNGGLVFSPGIGFGLGTYISTK